MEALNVSETIFNEARRTVMASSVRAITNRYFRKGVHLEIQVNADTYGVISEIPDNVVKPSVMINRYFNITSLSPSDRLLARIIIHREASRTLARLCVAKHIYELLIQLDGFIEGGRTNWPEISHSDEFASDSERFAYDLCCLHNNLYQNHEFVDATLKYPDGFFRKMFEGQTEASGSSLDSKFNLEQPFNAKLHL